MVQTHDPKNPMLPFLEQSENSVFRARLRTILRKLNEATPSPQASKSNASDSPKESLNGDSNPSIGLSGTRSATHIEELPEEFRQEYIERIAPLFEARRRLNREFSEDQTNAHRAEVSEKLHEVQNALNHFYNRVREFRDSGKVRNNRVTLFQQYLDATRLVSKLREKASRNKGQADQLNSILKEKEVAMKQVESLMEELHAIT